MDNGLNLSKFNNQMLKIKNGKAEKKELDKVYLGK